MNDMVFLITGAASGIGRHLTAAASRRGHRVLATDVDEAGLRRTCERDARVARAKLDVRREAEWESAFEAAEASFGPVSVLLNVAGYFEPSYVVDLAAGDVDLHFDVNVKGVVYGTRAAALRMTARGQGHIVNFGSLASLAPVPGLSLYSASKFAVRGFSLAAATELAPRGVAVTVVMPDAVDTPMLDRQVDYEEAAMTFSGSKPLTVEDIERAIFDEVLPKRPMELAIPFGRGVLARAANTAPALSRHLARRLIDKGKRAQASRKR